jgi:hypothetical protein
MIRAEDIRARVVGLPPVLQRLVVALLELSPEKRAELAAIGETGGIEIHWNPKRLQIFPHRPMVTRQVDELTVAGEDM